MVLLSYRVGICIQTYSQKCRSHGVGVGGPHDGGGVFHWRGDSYAGYTLSWVYVGTEIYLNLKKTFYTRSSKTVSRLPCVRAYSHSLYYRGATPYGCITQ